MSQALMPTIKATLEDYHQDLHEIISMAWAEWISPDNKYGLGDSRLRACAVWHSMIQYAKERFDGDPRVKVIERGQTADFFIDYNKVVFRFKKGDERRIGRNYPTQTALNLHQHDDSDLFETPYRVEVVYQLDATEQTLESTHVVARNGKVKLWEYCIDDAIAEGKSADVLGFPETGREHHQDARTIVRAKAKPVEQKSEERK